MARTPGAAAPLYLCLLLDHGADLRHRGDREHGDRHLPGDQHSGGLGALELRGAVAAGDGSARRHARRARLLQLHERYRAHRVAVAQRHQHHQGVLPARRRPGLGDGAARRGVAGRHAQHAAGHLAAVHAALQRHRRADPATQRRRVGAHDCRAQRLRHKLHPDPAGHGARRHGPAGVWRRAAEREHRY